MLQNCFLCLSDWLFNIAKKTHHVSGWNFTVLKQPLLVAIKDVKLLLSHDDIAKTLACPRVHPGAAIQLFMTDLWLLIVFLNP